MRARPSIEKRRREQQRQERKRDKAEKREKRKLEKESTAQGESGEDPDIAHIVWGPQPSDDSLDDGKPEV